MPISYVLRTADLCGMGTPGSLGDSTVFPNTRIPSQPAAAKPQHLVKQGRCPRAVFRLEERRRLGPQGGAEMMQMSPERASFGNDFPFLPIHTKPDLFPVYGEVATGTEQKAFTNITSVASCVPQPLLWDGRH